MSLTEIMLSGELLGNRRSAWNVCPSVDLAVAAEAPIAPPATIAMVNRLIFIVFIILWFLLIRILPMFVAVSTRHCWFAFPSACERLLLTYGCRASLRELPQFLLLASNSWRNSINLGFYGKHLFNYFLG